MPASVPPLWFSVVAASVLPRRALISVRGGVTVPSGYCSTTLKNSPWKSTSTTPSPPGTEAVRPLSYTDLERFPYIYGFDVAADGSLTSISGSPFSSGSASPQMLDIGLDAVGNSTKAITKGMAIDLAARELAPLQHQ